MENSASAGGLPVVSLSALYPLNASEDGPQSIVYAFSREGDLSEELMIDFTVQGRALFAGDYQQRGATSFTATGGSILFARGASVALLLIDPLSDPSSEGDETITLTLSPGEGYTIGANPTGIARIVDNDVAAGSLASVPVAQRFPFHSSFESRNKEFFAALKRDGSVVGWGGSTNWGSTSGVAGLDGDVIQIHANHSAAAALKRDGSVITWGDPDAGGSDSGGLDGGVVQIFSTGKAFAALKNDGSVISWGAASEGGDSSGVDFNGPGGDLTVTRIFATERAFAALRSDGSVVVWGKWSAGGDAGGSAAQLQSDVSLIFSNPGAFAALKHDGSVVCWGNPGAGGSLPAAVQPLVQTGVVGLASTFSAFAALRRDGSVVSWGLEGGDSTAVSSQLSADVTGIHSNAGAFAALKRGAVITWGNSSYGGDSSSIAGLDSGVARVVSTHFAFAALKIDGSVISWGLHNAGGDSAAVAEKLRSGVLDVVATAESFAALKDDGTVVTWGADETGGDSSGVDFNGPGGDLTVTRIFATERAFAALRSNGSVVTWGQYADTGAVADQLSRDVVTLLDPFLDDRLVPLTQSPLPRISLSVAPAAGVLEDGAPNLIFTFSRSGATALPLTVEYTVGGTATLGRDYTGIAPTPPTRTITFAAGSDTATLTVDPQADPDIEPNETVAIALAAGADYEINSADAVVGTIVSDDLPVISVRFAPVTVSEDGPDPLICTFSRTGPINKALTVFYNLGGTADSRDYSGDLSDRRSIRFERGARAVTARIDPKADEEFEADETITVALKPSSNYSIGNASPPEAVIENDDFPFVSLAVSPDFVAEDGPDKLIYTFTRTGSTGSELTVNYSLQTIGITNPATLADDYTGIPATPDIRTITFAAGSPTATISV